MTVFLLGAAGEAVAARLLRDRRLVAAAVIVIAMLVALLPFYSTKRSGTGLGLALAREIAEAHGGNIRLANREGEGLVVALELPLPPATQ